MKTKIVFTNEVNVEVFDKDFYYLLLQRILEIRGKKLFLTSLRVLLLIQVKFLFRQPSVNEIVFLSRVKCIAEQPLTEKIYISKIKQLTNFV